MSGLLPERITCGWCAPNLRYSVSRSQYFASFLEYKKVVNYSMFFNGTYRLILAFR